MWPILSGWFRKVQVRLYKHSIDGALALRRRNEFRSDGFTLKSACNRLEICWHARNLHPWDSGLSPEHKESAFKQQAVVRQNSDLPSNQADEGAFDVARVHVASVSCCVY